MVDDVKSVENPANEDDTDGQLILKGIAASPGIAIGKAVVFETEYVSVHRVKIPDHAIESEIDRFRQSVTRSKDQLLVVKQKLAADIGMEHAYIFDAHLMMLNDSSFLGQVERRLVHHRPLFMCDSTIPDKFLNVDTIGTWRQPPCSVVRRISELQ